MTQEPPNIKQQPILNPEPTVGRKSKFSILRVLCLLAIVVVIGTGFLTLVAVTFVHQVKRERVADTKAILTKTNVALLNFMKDTGRLPTTDEGIDALLYKRENLPDWHGPYLDKFPIDGWANPLFFVNPSPTRPGGYDLYSFGPDGIDGTADDIHKDMLK